MGVGLRYQPVALLDDVAYLSDESEFYGDDDTKAALEQRAAYFDVTNWWSAKLPSPTEIALTNAKSKKTVVHNLSQTKIDKNMRCDTRQPGETIEEFVERLPPRTTRQTDKLQWIWVYPEKQLRQEQVTTEGPLDDKADLQQFIEKGIALLSRLTEPLEQINNNNGGKAKGMARKEYNEQRNLLVQAIKETAVETKCTSGKWMLFVDPSKVNEVWTVVARYTANCDLGIGAKVAPDSGQQNTRLICVYTRDFTDLKDVARVARKMKEVGLIGSGKAIYYKPDAYTHLQLNRDNQWDIKTSIYNSMDVLSNATQTVISESFNTRKEIDAWPDKMDWE